MLQREARIVGDEDFPNWMVFREGLSYCEIARRMANWHHLLKKTSKLPSEIDVYVRDVGSKTQFLHTVKLSLQIDVAPAPMGAGEKGSEGHAGTLPLGSVPEFPEYP